MVEALQFEKEMTDLPRPHCHVLTKANSSGVSGALA